MKVTLIDGGKVKVQIRSIVNVLTAEEAIALASEIIAVCIAPLLAERLREALDEPCDVCERPQGCGDCDGWK